MREIDAAIYVSVHPTERVPLYVVLFADRSGKQPWKIGDSLENIAEEGLKIKWPWVAECLVQFHMWRGPAVISEDYERKLFGEK